MKKELLIGTALLLVISAFSQTSGRQRPAGLMNTRILADRKFAMESTATDKEIKALKPIAFPARKGAKTSSAITWQSISSSMNIYGVIISYCKPLQWNDELNAVTFIHRKSPTYLMSPAPAATAETGGIMAFVSTDCGAHWDSTALYSNDNFWGRYPSGAIYNPPSTTINTDISNAYIVAAGPATGTSATPWIANWYSSKKLGTANYNNAPSTATNAVQVMQTAGPFAPNVPSRHDFSAYNFTATDDGKMRVLAGITDDALSPASDTAVMLMTGTYNNGVFDWEGKIFDPPTTVASDGSDNFTSRPLMAWNESGSVGYVVIMGSRLGATGSNAGLQPIVYKTINYGSTWSLETTAINFNLPAYNDVKARIWGTDLDSNLKVPNFNWLDGMDCAVDADNKLHVFTSILGHPSINPDSLNFNSQWTTEKYLWPHTPGRMPYLFDFIYDGTNAIPAWSHLLIDSMSTEGPGETTADAGYGDNPWDMDPTANNGKVRIDARLQMSRTPDGKYLFYSWAESDIAFTNNQKNWNNLPNIKTRLYDVSLSRLSLNKIDATEDAISEVANRAMYHCVSPKFKLVSRTVTNATILIPMTVSNSNPYAQRTANTHWYSCASLDFAFAPPDGININASNSTTNSLIYPNPAQHNASVGISLSTTSIIKIDILNTMGQVVKSIQSHGQVGANTINVDLNGLSSGIYFVNIKVDNASSTKKLIIE